MHSGLAICLAWPETHCKQAGAWYDGLMRLFRINRKGYYKVGHAAVILIEIDKRKCFYFDFGRYHSPHGKGRVRSVKTDHDLDIKTKPVFGKQNKSITNIDDILLEVASNPSCHGTGYLLASYCTINFHQSFREANHLQNKEFIGYGPFIPEGTNCSRFVNRIIVKGSPSWLKKILLQFPATLTATPFWNVAVIGGIFGIIKINPGHPEVKFNETSNKEYGKNCITTGT